MPCQTVLLRPIEEQHHGRSYYQFQSRSGSPAAQCRRRAPATVGDGAAHGAAHNLCRWLVEQGKHEELDDAMTAASYETVTIKHCGGNLVTHWAVAAADLFVLCDGVQTIGEMKRSSV